MNLVLGIECTAHTFGIGIVDTDKKEVLFNEKSVFKDEHNGMDPRALSEFHIKHFDQVLIQAKNYLKTLFPSSDSPFSNLSLIAFSQGPGQGNSLKIAGLVAKTLALEYSLPIVGVNHIRAHLEIGKMHTGFKDPLFLNITGVNSQVVTKDEWGNYKIYGETEDIGLGNLLDSVARLLDLGFPGGPKIEEFARKGKQLLDIPYTLKGMNVSFAGLYSNIAQKIDSFKKTQSCKDYKGTVISYSNENDFYYDLCYSLQETVFAMIQEVAERALAYTNKKELVLVGGVAANKRFVEMTKAMCSSRGVVYDALPLPLCMDNGAMIAWAGWERREYANKRGEISNLQPKPYITVEDEI
jgi:glycoprotease/Kae1 family metallohydrolase